jgi:uncharacterized protein YndB with AHSA1/START domain
MTGKLIVRVVSDLELEMTRDFDAPRELVFQAWTEPEHVRHWWGQKGSTLTVCEIDLRVGGTWRFVELAQDGIEYPFKGEYLEIVRPERLSYTFAYDVEPFKSRSSVTTQVFEAVAGGSTRLVERTRFQSIEDRDQMIAAGMEQGAGESADRLDAYLRVLQQGA